MICIRQKCLLLINSDNKAELVEGLADIIKQGVLILSDISEVQSAVLTDYKDIVIVQDFPKDGLVLGKLKIWKYLFTINIYYIYNDKRFVSLLEDVAQCVQFDYTHINGATLQAIVDNDKALLGELDAPIDKDIFKQSESIARRLLDNKASEELQILADAFINLQELYSNTLERLNLFKESSMELENKLLNITHTKDKLLARQVDLLANIHKINNNIKQYNVILDRDVYDKVYTSDFNNKPVIIYIKEWEEFLHLESFLQTLYDCFRVKARLSCKIIKLLDSSSSKKVLAIPEKYYNVQSKFNSKYLDNNDFIIRFGNHVEVLKQLLINRVGVDVLIVYDQKSHSDVCIMGDGIIYLNTCRNENNMKHYGLFSDNTITNTPSSKLPWLHMNDYNKLVSLDPNKLFYELSSNAAIEYILTTYTTYMEYVR